MFRRSDRNSTSVGRGYSFKRHVPVLRIRNVYPGYENFPSRIQGQKDSRIRIRIIELKILNPKNYFKALEICSSSRIQTPDPDLDFLPIPSGSES